MRVNVLTLGALRERRRARNIECHFARIICGRLGLLLAEPPEP